MEVEGLDQYEIQLEEAMREAYEVASTSLRMVQKTQQRDYDLTVNERSYTVGDVVYHLDTADVKVKLCHMERSACRGGKVDPLSIKG